MGVSPSRMQAWLQLIAPIVTIVGVAVWIVRLIHRLDRRLERIELRIGSVEYQNRALLKAFPQVIASLVAANQMTPQQGSQLIAMALETVSIDELLSKIQPIPNPLPLEDLNRLRNYVQRLKQGDWLRPEEAHDFYRLTGRDYKHFLQRVRLHQEKATEFGSDYGYRLCYYSLAGKGGRFVFGQYCSLLSEEQLQDLLAQARAKGWQL